VNGYRVGQRHDRRAYEESAVSTARQQAERAVRNGPNLAMAHVQLAMVLIIQGELRTAWDHLNTADSLDEQSFYPWYLRTVIAIHHKDEKFAAEGFKEIESRASQKYQKRLLLQERMRLAKATKNLVERDRLYREMIDLDPDYAYAWGNYGSFLLGQKRYREAVHNLERAVELKPYGLAVSQLAEARRKLNQAF
jgi:Tfp pilus assembly protein PilF